MPEWRFPPDPMDTIYRITVKAIPADALLFLLLAVLGNTLRVSHGHMDPTQLAIVTVAVLGVGGYFVLSACDESPTLRMEIWLAGLWFLFASFLVLKNQTIYAEENIWHIVVNVGLWVNAIFSLYLLVGLNFGDDRDPFWQRIVWVPLLLWPLILVALLHASPNPKIDVFSIGSDAAKLLLGGRNPYQETFADIYGGAYGYAAGYVYLPSILLFNTLFYYMFGDIRFTYIFSQIVVLFFVWQLARKRGLSLVASSLFGLIWISFPVTLFVLEQAWNDTLTIAFSAALVFSLDRQTRDNSTFAWVLTGIFLGLVIGSKQYAFVVGWITVLYVWRNFGWATALRVIFLGLAVLSAGVLPFFLSNPQVFIERTLFEIASYPIRIDAMSWTAYVLASTGFETLGSMVGELYLVSAVAVTFWFISRPKATLFHWAWALFLIYGVVFLFGKQAFCNYYYFLSFFIVLAILFSCGRIVDNLSVTKAEGFCPGRVFPPAVFWTLMSGAVLVRIIFLDLIEFKEDELNAIVLAHRLLTGGGLEQAGLKLSSGLYNPPLFIYLLSLPVYFTTDPRWVTLFIIVFNLLGVFLLYRLLKWAFSRNVAALTTLLFTSSPWPVLLSRKLGASGYFFTFFVGMVAVLVSLSEKYRSWKVWVFFILFSAITQLYMVTWFLLPAILLFMIRFRVGIAWKDLVVGLSLLVACYFPYFQLHQKTQFQNVFDAVNFAGQMGQDLFADHLLLTFFTSTGLGFQHVVGKLAFGRFWDGFLIVVPNIFFLLFFLLTVVGLVGAATSSWPFRVLQMTVNKDAGCGHKTKTLFWLVVATFLAVYPLLKVPAIPYFGALFFPALFLFAVLVLEKIHARLTLGYQRQVVAILVAGVVLSNLYFVGGFYSFVYYNPQKIAGDYGVPYFDYKDKWQRMLPSWGKR